MHQLVHGKSFSLVFFVFVLSVYFNILTMKTEEVYIFLRRLLHARLTVNLSLTFN